MSDSIHKDKGNASRRDFLKVSAATMGALSIARGAHAAGGDEIKVALIGCGGRGTGAAVNCLDADQNIKLVAMADAVENRLVRSLENIKKIRESKVDVPKDRCFVGFDAYRDAIRSPADLVILAAPPAFRPQHYQAAVEAGKNAFLEKPCCVDAAGFRSLLATNKLAQDKGLKVGVGLAWRHRADYIEAMKRIHDGAIGPVTCACVYWKTRGTPLFPREPGESELAFQIRNWRHFNWLSGEPIVHMHVSNLDIANWAMREHPVAATGVGGCSARFARNCGDSFDHHAVEFTYPDGTRLFSHFRAIECFHKPMPKDTACPRCGAKSSSEMISNLLGNKCPQCAATVLADMRPCPRCDLRIGEEVYGSNGCFVKTERTCEILGRNAWKFQGDSGNPYETEMRELLGAIRNNRPHNEATYGATSSFTAILGRMASHTNMRLMWDDAMAMGPSTMPERMAWDVQPPVVPDDNGFYPIAVPGITKPWLGAENL